MRVTVNAEFSDTELKQYGLEMLVKGIAHVTEMIGSANPNALLAANQAIQGMLGQVMAMRGRVRPGAGPHPMYGFGAPPGYVAAPGYGAPPGYYGPQSQGAPPGYGPMGPDNVRPIREPAHVEQCFPIEATRNVEAGWGCCRCATYNHVQRAQCRNCGHVLCHGAPPIVTPPPEPGMPPQGA